MKLKWSHANSASILKRYTEKVVYMYFTITVNSLWGCLHGGKVDHPIVFCILVYMQRVVLVPSAGIFLVIGSS